MIRDAGLNLVNSKRCVFFFTVFVLELFLLQQKVYRHEGLNLMRYMRNFYRVLIDNESSMQCIVGMAWGFCCCVVFLFEMFFVGSLLVVVDIVLWVFGNFV